ncbi:hypothetical protein CYMTET_3434 [Cymbomonas tetramitiformis]|uniref:HAT C-terminal dimerisation domain-containing protein n=1 Tax=Cymbomonas tetramitiformis TaxID=36881 RepID=A0AAE0LLI9_9CHLO|nr:hypothetical protein CYMTET_3434 [Cymbomonas tetramitiformis]
MTAHYNHSVIGQKFLHQCQELYGLGKSNPPKDNATRTGWGGAFTQAKWFMDNQEAVQMYDVEHTVKAKNAMDNPDGSKYKDHKLTQSEWNTVRESVFVLQHPKGAVMLLQATKKSTVNIVLPVIGKLLEALHEETVLKWEKRPVQTQCEVVRDGRQNLYKAVKKRFTNDLMSCKLEDFCVATTLDPRYKTFKFPKSTDWDRGTLTPGRAIGWARSAWTKDWKPKEGETVSVIAATPKSKKKTAEVTLSDFMGDSDEDDEETIVGSSEARDPKRDEDEFDEYLAMPVERVDFDVQQWWRSHKFELPHLAKMARQFLGVPASTAGVERIFSACGQMHSDLRKSTNEEMQTSRLKCPNSLVL